MALATMLVERLALNIAEDLRQAQPGYCLRVDHLDAQDALTVCRRIREELSDQKREAWVLSTAGAQDGLTITAERAIEVRNRKQVCLALLVPTAVMDTTTSSLTNSFATFSLDRFWEEAVRALAAGLPDEIQSLVRRIMSTPRGSMSSRPEQRADYLAAIASEPSVTRAGAEMWRLGLIPDVGGDSCIDRLERNLQCARELIHPARANTSARERLEACGLRDGRVKTELLAYLGDKRLRDIRGWLPGLAEEPHRARISFDAWIFIQGQASDLESIEVLPFLDEDGRVQEKSGFHQDAPGAQPVAPIGPKSKIKIAWQSNPTTPANLKRWKAEIIPSRDYYPEGEAPPLELPQARSAAKTKKISIPLDVELPEDASVAAQVRVVGLDEQGNELADPDGRPIEGISEEFWIKAISGEVAPPPPSERRATVPNIPYARLKAVCELPIATIDEMPGEWSERDLHYFSIRFNSRYTARLGLSPVLRRIEQRSIDEQDCPACYRATSEGSEILDADSGIVPQTLTALMGSEDGQQFLRRRKEFVRKLAEQKHRGLIETADWTPELTQRAVAYANAYGKLLDEAKSPELLRDALQVETLSLDIAIGSTVERSVLVLPTHPLRVLWYAAYHDLLRSWESDLLKEEKRRRPKLVDMALLTQLTPLNCPAMIPDSTGGVFLFVQSLKFFWGIALPLEVRNPARRIAHIARSLALSEDEASLADLPPERVSQELRAYHEVHRYLETLRVSLVNPGVGTFAAEALRGFYAAGTGDADDDVSDERQDAPPRLELFAHVTPPLPTSLPPLTRLQQQLYETRPRGRHHHLAPFFSISIRPEDQVVNMPGGDVNVSLIMDRLRPEVVSMSDDATGNSCSLGGLLVRMLPGFEAGSDGVRWQHRFRLAIDAHTARHPTNKAFTPALVNTHQSVLSGLGRLLDGGSSERIPAVAVTVASDERKYLDAVHDLSDWVITLDRFFGVEFYDAPSDPGLAEVAQKYLLDYAPEFLDGLGHRMLVTTTHREEVEEILARAMTELGFQHIEDSVGRVLRYLKTISGRLALRVLGDDGRAREAVSLGVVAAYLEKSGELSDSILVPIDAHPELFGPVARKRTSQASASRCDLLRVQLRQNRLVATFIEVKSRVAPAASAELAERMVDQIEATERVFREMFFQEKPARVDQLLQRARLATILHFYLRRAVRYGLIHDDDTRAKLSEAIDRLESGISQLRVVRWGFIVNLQGKPQRVLHLRDAEIRFLTANDVLDAGFSTSAPDTPPATVAAKYRPDVNATQPMLAAEGSVPDAAAESPATGEAALPTASPSPDSLLPTPANDPTTIAPMEAPPETTTLVDLGQTLDGEPVLWRSGVKGSPHLFIVGIPGQGKSVTTTRILCELGRQGLPALVIDFHGQFTKPESLYNQVAHPAVLDAVHGLPFSPFEAEVNQSAGTNWWKSNCFAVSEIFQYVCGLGDMQRDAVYQALCDCYVDLGFEAGTPERLPTIAEFAKRLEELEQERKVSNVIARCRPLLEFGLFPESASADALKALLERGLVVDVSHLGVEALQLAAGAFLLRKVYKDMFLWGDTKRLRLAIVLDEAHRLARDVTLPKIMKEGRKYGIVVVVASQGLDDFHPDVVGNAGTKIVFRTNYPMSKRVAGFLRGPKGVDLPAAVEQLEVGEAFLQTPDMSTCTRSRMHEAK